MLWPLGEVLFYDTQSYTSLLGQMPGLLLIGSNGGGELLGLDLRASVSQVILVYAISGTWAKASRQSTSVSGLIEMLRAGAPYDFEPTR